MEDQHAIVRVVANVVIAGTMSEVTGGKFANGAISAAFRVVFNEFGLRKERNLQAALAQDPFESEQEYKEFVNTVNDQTGGLIIPYWNCLDGCTSAEFGIETTAVFLPFARVGNGVTRGAKIWTSTRRGSSASNAFRHWKSHGKEFPELVNASQYVKATQAFLKNPPRGTLTKHRPNGEIVRYNPLSNTFGVLSSNGVPKTMFKPNVNNHRFATNLEYFNAQ